MSHNYIRYFGFLSVFNSFADKLINFPNTILAPQLCEGLKKHKLQEILVSRPLAVTQALSLGCDLYGNAVQTGGLWRRKGEVVQEINETKLLENESRFSTLYTHAFELQARLR